MADIRDYVAAKRKKNPNMRIGSLRQIVSAQQHPPMTTGNIVSDYVTSIGGIPRGLVTEIRGFMSSGKSTLAAQAAAAHQQRVKRGEDTGAILYLDFEYAVDFDYFAALGLDVDDDETFVYMQPETLEEGFQVFREMTQAGLLAIGIVDSVAAMSCAAEMEGDVGKQFIGNRAKAIQQALRMSIGPMRVHGTGLVLINHVQVKIPQTFGEKQAAMRGIQETVSPGGVAIPYYSSMRLETSKPSQNKEEVLDELTNDKAKQVTSTDVIISCFKNKVGIPHRTGKMRVQFGKGFNQTYSSFHILVDNGIIKKKAGGRYEFPEVLLPHVDTTVPVGEAKILDALEADPEWADLIVARAKALVLSEQAELGEDVVIEDVDTDSIDPLTGEVLNV